MIDLGQCPSLLSTFGICHLFDGWPEGRASWLIVALCEQLAVSFLALRCNLFELPCSEGVEAMSNRAVSATAVGRSLGWFLDSFSFIL